ncbi:hypothetical protein [Salinarchaeum chitinilyticum]
MAEGRPLVELNYSTLYKFLSGAGLAILVPSLFFESKVGAATTPVNLGNLIFSIGVMSWGAHDIYSTYWTIQEETSWRSQERRRSMNFLYIKGTMLIAFAVVMFLLWASV